jgi:hypothetical protein
MNRRYAARCTIAGILWGALAYVLGYRAFGALVFSGIAASPLIGLVIGAASLTLKRASISGG